MKRIYLIILAAISISTQIFSQTPNDFRGFSWGKSISEVQKAELSKFILKDKDDALEYADQLAGSDCNVIYTFNENDKLISGTYEFTRAYRNQQLNLQDYKRFRSLLITKYGQPKTDNSEQTAENNLIDRDLNLNAAWETERSMIKIDLVEHDNKLAMRIHYTTKSLNELDSEKQLKEALSKL